MTKRGHYAFYVKNQEEFEKVQKQLFKYGIVWCGSGDDIETYVDDKGIHFFNIDYGEIYNTYDCDDPIYDILEEIFTETATWGSIAWESAVMVGLTMLYFMLLRKKIIKGLS